MQKWADFLREVDPDIITGYNIQNFDFAYLLARAKHLNIVSFSYLGRLKVRADIFSLEIKQKESMIRM